MSESARSAKIGVSNKTERPRIVWVEPIPEDYTLLPGESLEIFVNDRSVTPWFHIVEWKDSSQIYVQGVILDNFLKGIITVLQDGNRLKPGHQREKGLEAGLKY